MIEKEKFRAELAASLIPFLQPLRLPSFTSKPAAATLFAREALILANAIIAEAEKSVSEFTKQRKERRE